MTILSNGVAVTGTTHHAEWCATEGLVHDKWMAEQICRHLKPGNMVIEGGAHIGTLTVPMLDAGATVIAYEPNPDAYKCLCRNCGLRGLLMLAALGEKSGQLTLIVDEENSGKTWCCEADGKDMVVTLDEEFQVDKMPAITLIKLDIEGWELKALKGGQRLIARHRPILILEVNEYMLYRAGDSRAALLAYVDEIGYSREILQPDLCWEDEQYDIRCLPK